MTAAADHALARSRKAVADMLRDPEDIGKNVAIMLQNIASGNAPSRQEETLCLMTAAGKSCPYSDRASCIGCGYEIYTKSAMHTLMQEYTRLNRLRKLTGVDSWRYGMMLERAVYPAISEMLHAMKLLCSADTTELTDIVERGILLADHGL